MGIGAGGPGTVSFRWPEGERRSPSPQGSTMPLTLAPLPTVVAAGVVTENLPSQSLLPPLVLDQ